MIFSNFSFLQRHQEKALEQVYILQNKKFDSKISQWRLHGFSLWLFIKWIWNIFQSPLKNCPFIHHSCSKTINFSQIKLCENAVTFFLHPTLLVHLLWLTMKPHDWGLVHINVTCFSSISYCMFWVGWLYTTMC